MNPKLKKILTITGAGFIVLMILPLLSAFEAHIINVTAQIDNKLLLNPIPDIDFGIAFPQEKLDRFFDITGSQTFWNNTKLDDIEYVVRQKPKCDDGQGGHPPVNEDLEGNFVCPEGSTIMPLLCPYLSKEEITTDGTDIENDGPRIPPFHGLPPPWTLATTLFYETTGKIIKSASDTVDRWNIDLKVPCFEGQCAQDWPDFIREQSENPDIDPEVYKLDPANEHKLFGCDLWLEVVATSSFPGCDEKIDLMLVLDRSGSINLTELADLKTAAKAFVDAIAPSADESHVGMSSFASTASLNQHLTDDGTAVKTSIDALVAGGFTNLKGGIDLATGELDDLHEHERPPIKDVMVIITDGAPNRPLPSDTADDAAAASADDARTVGIEIFVVGVGVSPATELYLKTDIADDASHYFSAADFADLETVLEDLVTCP